MSGIPLLKKAPVQTTKKNSGTSYSISRQVAFGTKCTASKMGQKGLTHSTQKVSQGEENAKLTAKITELRENLQRFEKNMSATHNQEEMQQLQKSAEEKENRLTGEIEELKTNNLAYQEKLNQYEKQLLLHNIDPVTFALLEPDTNQIAMALKKREVTQAKVSSLKQKIDSLNKGMDVLLDNYKILDKHLDEIAAEELIQ